MKFHGKKVAIALLLVGCVSGSLILILAGGPYYQGRPVGQWAINYSQKLYPSGTAPLSPSQRGLVALRNMGPQKAATALVQALSYRDSPLYARYRLLHPKLPSWFQSRFPLRLTPQQRVTLVLGGADFLDVDCQRAMTPFLVGYLHKSDIPAQIAACELLGNMPEAALPALPALKPLTSSAELSLSQSAQAAINRIAQANAKSQPTLVR